jgi:hypothetical protein
MALRIENAGGGQAILEYRDQLGTRSKVHAIASREAKAVPVQFSESSGYWYGLDITDAVDSFGRRISGRMETAKDTISRPKVARLSEKALILLGFSLY